MLETNKVYKHYKGNLYVLLAISNLKATKDDYRKDAIYVDIEGNTWSRPIEEFEKNFELTDQTPWCHFYIAF